MFEMEFGTSEVFEVGSGASEVELGTSEVFEVESGASEVSEALLIWVNWILVFVSRSGPGPEPCINRCERTLAAVSCSWRNIPSRFSDC